MEYSNICVCKENAPFDCSLHNLQLAESFLSVPFWEEKYSFYLLGACSSANIKIVLVVN
jgi:hypothetical protein